MTTAAQMLPLLERAKGGEAAAATEAVTKASAMLDAPRSIRRAFEPYWSLVRAFYLGHQGARVRAGRFVAPTEVEVEQDFYSNQILPRARALVAGLTASQPRAHLVTADEDDGDARKASALGDEILTALRRQVKEPAVLRSALLDTVLYGIGFLWSGWNPNEGPTVEVHKCVACERGVTGDCAEAAGGAEFGSVACPHCGAPLAVTTTVERGGDFFARTVSPFHLLAPEEALTLRDAQWVNLEHHMSRDRAVELYGEGSYKEELVDLRSNLMPGARDGARRRAVRIFETMWRKCGAAPLGLRMTFHSGRLLDWSLEISGDGELPIAAIVADEAPDRFWPKGIGEDLVPLQIRFNRSMNRLEKMEELAADPELLAEEGIMTPGDELLPSMGRVRQYKTEAKRVPQYADAPEISPVFIQHLKLLMDQMDFIAQQYAPFRGQPGESVTSGLQARLLIERTATSLSSMTTSIEEAVARQGKILLMAAQRHMDEERVFSFAGEHGAPKVTRFRKADLAGYQDVVVVPGSAFPESREARRDFMLEMSKVAATVGPDAQRSILEALEAGLKMPADPMQVVRDQCAAEHDVLFGGGDVAVHELQFHDAHIREHYLTAATERWATAPIEKLVALLRHIREHEVAQAVEAMRKKKIERQVAAVGGDGGDAGDGADDAAGTASETSGAASGAPLPAAAPPETMTGGMQ